MMSSAIFLLLATAMPLTRSAETSPPTSTVQIRVTDRSGAPLKSAQVTTVKKGSSQRVGETSASGRVTFHNMRVGTYLLRAERDAFIRLEKEFTVKPGERVYVVAALSPVPPPAPAPPPPSSSIGPAGDPRILFIPDFAEKQLIRHESIKASSIGCAGATEARLIQMREPITAHTHGDAEEMLYVVAGEGTLKIGELEQRISPGWFSMVPRGLEHSLSRTGRNPVVILSLLSGQPCPQFAAVAGAGR
jgi:mannose-6-phosphate isomerase-like protein (cupin superfamily)